MNKKNLRIALVGLCMVFMLFSCDASLDGFLEVFNGNLFIDTGLVKVDTSVVDSLFSEKIETEEGYEVKTVDNKVQITLGDGKESLEILLGDVDESLKSALGKGITPPMTDQGLTDFNRKLNEITQSPQKKDAFVKELQKEVTGEEKDATQGTFALAAVLVEQATKDMEGEEAEAFKPIIESVTKMAKDIATAESVTKSDALTAQIMVGIAGQVTALGDIDEEDEAAMTAAQTNLINSATVLLTLSEQDAGKFDIGNIEGVDELISKFLGSSESEASNE